MKKVKVSISTSSSDINGQVNPVFDRCPGHIIAEVEGSEIKSHSFIPNNPLPRGAGISVAQTAIFRKVNAVISGNIGPKAFEVLQQAGIKFYPAPKMNIKEAIEKLAAGELKEKTSASVDTNFGKRNFGSERERGFSRGRRQQQ